MKYKLIYTVVICLVIVVFLIFAMSQKNYALRESDRDKYIVEVTRTYLMSEEPTEIVSKHVIPGELGTLNKDVTVKKSGYIKGGHAKATRLIMERVTVNINSSIKYTSPKGTVMINPQTIGGDYGAGFIAGLGFCTRYVVQEGYTCEIKPDGSYGEKINFIAKEPQSIWLGWKTVESYNPAKKTK